MNREETRVRAAERCWSVIGVLGGDRSCPELVERTHCRECPVIVVAAHRLLSRLDVDLATSIGKPVTSAGSAKSPTSAGAMRAPTSGGSIKSPTASGIAAPRRFEPEPAAQTFSVITFDVGGTNLALEAKRIVEVSATRPIRRVPHRASAAFLGLVNVQGKLEPCFSLSVVLGLPPDREPTEQRLVVVGDESRRCAFHIQRVALREADLGLVGDPPATVSAALDTHVRGIVRLADRPWSLLDVDRLLVSLERTLA